ncbi:hypothetical protein Pmar_PMAR007049 [Perkinsus marinus ATCC 50983]|uniref:Uncharacterized protein n=1 Tax=Perkinsus marinus (strain ATCC 50983 / TXsc) TaxID=423536 RepID=C5KZM5_PERM5|nr:hypothetical protein Pmar_PMAR007049 [Perkinsus marinus ATCC 50983]EER10053.1 hypothetical protein Pmar_PMAR007049 [Perkinsus marinus ATCC 50983]|eukprot:XP_002778258.1 hypothetical protein Pmar_PMAR007049 [Perkinsus marinus ATCC 50983]
MSTDEEWLQITTLPYLVTSIGPVASWSVDDYVAVATEKVVYVLDATAFLEGTTRSALAAAGVTGPVRLLKGQITPSRQITGGEFQAKRLKLENGEEEFHAAKLLSRRRGSDKEVKLKAMALLEGGIKAATNRSRDHPEPVKRVSTAAGGRSKRTKKTDKKSTNSRKKSASTKRNAKQPKSKAKKRRSIVRSDSESEEEDDDDSDFHMESEPESSSSDDDDASELVPENSEADDLSPSRPQQRGSTVSNSSAPGIPLGASNLLGQCGGPAGVQDLWVGDVQRVAGENSSTQADILTLLQQHYSVMSTSPKSVHWSPGYACGQGPDCPALADLNPSEAWAAPPSKTPPLITIEPDGQCGQPIELDAVVTWAPRKIGPTSRNFTSRSWEIPTIPRSRSAEFDN